MTGSPPPFLRQQSPQGQASLADFHRASRLPWHWIQTTLVFCVTAGHGLEEWCVPFRDDDDDYRKSWPRPGGRLAEAAAEWLHREVRNDHWGYADEERWTMQPSSQKNTAASALHPATPPARTTKKKDHCGAP